MTLYVKNMTRLFRRVHPTMSEEKKLRHLMQGGKEQLFAGLVRSPPKTVAEFLTEATTMEKMLQQCSAFYERQLNASSPLDQHSAPYNRHANAASLTDTIAFGNVDVLRDLIHSVVRDELQGSAARLSPRWFPFLPS